MAMKDDLLHQDVLWHRLFVRGLVGPPRSILQFLSPRSNPMCCQHCILLKICFFVQYIRAHVGGYFADIWRGNTYERIPRIPVGWKLKDSCQILARRLTKWGKIGLGYDEWGWTCCRMERNHHKISFQAVPDPLQRRFLVEIKSLDCFSTRKIH